MGFNIWNSKTMLQLLVNQGNLQFTDESDQLNSQYDQDSVYDYSLRMADVDQSGINTYFMAQYPPIHSVNGTNIPENSRQGNYILVNDGTGNFHVAMHDEFLTMGNYVNQYLAYQFNGTGYWIGFGSAGNSNTPRFIAYQTPSGLINFIAVAPYVSQQVNGQQFNVMALVNVPVGINLKTDYKENLTITNRNGSHLIRTFAGDDVIYSGNDGGFATIDGGLGTNTVIYSGKLSNYTITKTSIGYTVKDNVGNDGIDTLINIQALQFSDISVTLGDLALSVSITGTGGGTVTSNSGTISWNGSNGTAYYSSGTNVTLTATPSSGSTFTGWSGGGCSGTGTCTVTMTAATSVTATFATIQVVQVGSTGGNSTIQSGYDTAGTGADIEVQAGTTYVGNDNFNRNISVSLLGGYNSSFSTDSSYSVITGPLIISNGTVTVRNLIIQ